MSNTCTMANLLAKLPYNQTDRCDIDAVLDKMRGDNTSTAKNRTANNERAA